MATGSGKTFTAISSVYRLIKHAEAKRILFLVDTKTLVNRPSRNLWLFAQRRQPQVYRALYRATPEIVFRGLTQVCISTIQRMYSLLRAKNWTKRRNLTTRRS